MITAWLPVFLQWTRESIDRAPKVCTTRDTTYSGFIPDSLIRTTLTFFTLLYRNVVTSSAGK